MEKICKTCKVEKSVELFHKNGNRYGKQEYTPSCKECFNAKSRVYQRSKYVLKGGRWNPEFSEKEGKKRCKKCNIVKTINEFSKRYAKERGRYRGTCKFCMGPSERKRQRRLGKQSRDNLTDRYVKHQFKYGLGISGDMVPKEYIELARKSIKMHRIIKSKINK